jgi:hypothetical protein
MLFSLIDEADTTAGDCARDTRGVRVVMGIRASEIGGIYCTWSRDWTHVPAAKSGPPGWWSIEQ